MISYTKGNLLEANVEALVNTVNTVGVMGKGIALMFKEQFPENTRLYAQACKRKEVVIGKMFVTQTNEMFGPKWIINFPTKEDWRNSSKLEWIRDGLEDLKKVIVDYNIKSIAIPPLGAGNGGLDWNDVKALIEEFLSSVKDIDIYIYEPTSKYRNVRKKSGVEILTPARAMISELVRRYWILGIECTLLEIQKLIWFLQCNIERNRELKNEINAKFVAHYYGPYAHNISYLLDKLDGSYLLADRRIPDCKPSDVIWFNNDKSEVLSLYLASEAKMYKTALDDTIQFIEGFESPFGLELLSTVDWLVNIECYKPELESIKEGLSNWKAGRKWGERKLSLFSDDDLCYALERVKKFNFSI